MKKLLVVSTLAITIVVLLSACHAKQSQPTEEEVEKIVVAWFLQKHHADAAVTGSSPLQVGEKTWYTRVNVTVQGEPYELVLDGKNEPVADNVDCCAVIRKLAEQQAGGLDPIKPCSDMEIDLFPSFSYVDGSYRYVSVCDVAIDTIPERALEDGWQQFAQTLNGMGIDELWISIVTPEFLRSHGPLQLAGKAFDTGDTREAFARRFSELIDSIHWDEQKFSAKLRALRDAGIRDPRFCVSGWASGTTLEIALSYEPGENGADAADLLADMDDSYFSISGREVTYVVNVEEPAS